MTSDVLAFIFFFINFFICICQHSFGYICVKYKFKIDFQVKWITSKKQNIANGKREFIWALIFFIVTGVDSHTIFFFFFSPHSVYHSVVLCALCALQCYTKWWNNQKMRCVNQLPIVTLNCIWSNHTVNIVKVYNA